MFVQVYKKGDIPHYNWHTREVYRDNKGVVCFNRGPRVLHHQTRKKTFTFPNDALEFYWFGKPYSIHIARRSRDEGLHYYANIHDIPLIGESEISFVDYDLDVIREGRSPARIVDGEEFERHQVLYAYSPEIIEMVPAAAEEVRLMINRDPRYQEDALVTAFDLIGRGEQDFLSRWTEEEELS
ncbi:MAG: DUF402 domain-containing protein [Spirochaetales bacterium]|nr:DUF402 domain-containing protein [Spirochaetales bacterium]